MIQPTGTVHIPSAQRTAEELCTPGASELDRPFKLGVL